MRYFLFNSEEQLDKVSLSFLENEIIPGVLPCRWVRWNDKIQLVYFVDGFDPLGMRIKDMSFDTAKQVCLDILDLVKAFESQSSIYLENVVWDADSIYLDEDEQVYIICLPAVLPDDSDKSKTYVKRIYSLLHDVFNSFENGDFINRQLEIIQDKNPESWDAVKEAVNKIEPFEKEYIELIGINTPEPVEFRVGRSDFIIGSDESADGYLNLPGISPAHAVIGWNDISFFIKDLESQSGTFLNDFPVSSALEVPFGSGCVIKFGAYTFYVE